MVRTRTIGVSSYAELCCASNFSFLHGGSHAEELVTQAKHLGLSAIAVTDQNTLAGVVRGHGAAKDQGLRFVVGVRLELQLSHPLPPAGYSPGEDAEGERFCFLPQRSWGSTPKGGGGGSA